MNSMKRFFAICLCLAMLFSLTACGKESNGDQQQPVRDFVYTTEFKTLEDADGRFREAVIRDGKMYYIKWTYDEETGRGGQTFCTMDMDTMQTTEVPLDQSQNGGTAGMSVLEDGSILMVSTDWDENGQSSFAPVTMDANGQETARHDITAPMMQGSNPEFGVYPQAVEVDPEGNVYVIVGGQTEKIIVFNLQGQKMFELTTDNWYQGLCQSADGRVFAMCYDNSATGSGYMLQYIDVKAKSFGDSFKGIPNGNGGTSTAKGGENEILISTGNILYSYNLADQTCEEILNWIDCDINSNQIEKFSRLDDGRILAFTMNYEAADGMPVAEAVYLTKTPASEVKQKTILTYGTMYLDSEARPRIIQFNKTNETYRIEVKEYGTGDYQAGMTQMNSDIVSGNAPDIIDLNGINTNVNTYIAKGVLTDLYALLDQDENLKRDDFVANVLKNFEQDGKLYGIPVKFTISTVMGRTSVVGDKMGWTVADVQKLMASRLPMSNC